jgi:hypothetical protein
MKNEYKILLDYIINKSYTDKEAMDVLNKYDAARTGKPLSEVALINSLIRHGDYRLAIRMVSIGANEKV